MQDASSVKNEKKTKAHQRTRSLHSASRRLNENPLNESQQVNPLKKEENKIRAKKTESPKKLISKTF